MMFGNTADYLPHKPVREFERRETIYDAQNPTRRLYMVVVGRVKVTNVSPDGTQTIVRIAGPEALFGESSLIPTPGRRESAVALDRSAVMTWDPDEIELQIERMPMLGMALSRYFVTQSLELQQRIIAMSAYGIPKRVSVSLLQLAETLGTPREDGSMRMGSLTQNTIAEFVGTSREMLSLEMNRLRRLGMVRYSRQFIDVYTQALAQSLREEGLEMVRASNRELRRVAGF
jgi:CRP-like cAMP-binding protein